MERAEGRTRGGLGISELSHHCSASSEDRSMAETLAWPGSRSINWPSSAGAWPLHAGPLHSLHRMLMPPDVLPKPLRLPLPTPNLLWETTCCQGEDGECKAVWFCSLVEEGWPTGGAHRTGPRVEGSLCGCVPPPSQRSPGQGPWARITSLFPHLIPIEHLCWLGPSLASKLEGPLTTTLRREDLCSSTLHMGKLKLREVK